MPRAGVHPTHKQADPNASTMAMRNLQPVQIYEQKQQTLAYPSAYNKYKQIISARSATRLTIMIHRQWVLP